MKKRLLVYLLMIIVSYSTIYAQGNTHIKLSGVISDSISNRPLECVNIAVINKGTGKLEAYTISDENGCFQVNAPSNKELYLRFSLLGYNDEILIWNENKLNGNLSIFLTEKSQILDEIVVQGVMPQFKSEVDGFSMQVENTLLSDAGTAIDVLSKLPKVLVQDNSISIIGTGTPKIYINGTEINSATVLEAMSSTEIKSVKVINSPDVRFSASSSSIIEIETVAKKIEGWGWQVQSITGKGQGWRQTIAPTFNISSKVISANFSYNYRYADNYYEEFYTRFYGDDDIYNSIYSKSKLNGAHYWRTAINFHPHKKHYIGIQSLGNISARNEEVLNNTTISDINSTSAQNGPIDKTSIINSVIYTYNAMSNGFIAKISYDNSFFKYNKEYKINEDSKSITNIITTNNYINSIKLDSEIPLYKEHKLDIGTHLVSTTNRGESIFNNTKTYDDISEYNIAAYISFSGSVNKLSYNCGLRFEYNLFQQVHQAIRRDDNDYFPNIGLSYKFTDEWGITAKYSKQIYRPTYDDLNPAIIYIDQYAYFQGNPELLPTIKKNIELTIDYKEFAKLSFSYTRKNNDLAWIVLEDNINNNVSKATQINLDKVDCYSLDAIIPYQNNWFSGYVASGIKCNQSWQDDLYIDNTMYYIQSNLNFKIPKNIELGCDLRYSSRGLENIFYYDPIFRCDLTLKKSFFDKRLSVTFAWKDIFKSDWMNTYTHYKNNFVGYKYYSDKSVLQLSIVYKFVKNKIKNANLNNSISTELERIKHK